MIKLKLDNIEELKEQLLGVHEKYYFELKEASNLPSTFWDSYSSFCNTSGGWIVLGVKEGKPTNTITGVGNKEKILVDFWNLLSNPNKISYRSVENHDVTTCEIDGKDVILIYVNEAPDIMKPVYTKGKLENTWIRTGDGDRVATREQLAAFFRNAQPIQDTLIAKGIQINDLDQEALALFKAKVSSRYPKMKFHEMTDIDFLVKIGAGLKNEAGDFCLKMGTLLFFGKVNVIQSVFPRFHLDYFNRRGGNPRWIDRVSDDEPSEYEVNIFNFYRIVQEKLGIVLTESFALDGAQIRIPVSDFDETLRECLVNCLAHADYVQAYPSTKICVHDGWFSFNNPGKMLIPMDKFVVGGDSRPRNETIMKLFRLYGVSERQGFGGPLIFKSAALNDYRLPEIKTDIEHTELRVWNIDLADSYPDLSSDEKNVLRFIVKSGAPQSIPDMRHALGISDYKCRKCASILERQQFIQKIGNGPSTKYVVSYKREEMLTQIQIKVEELKALQS